MASSCIEEEYEQLAKPLDSEILAAKSWYESVETQQTGTENARKVKNGKGKPDWSKSKVYTQSDGKRVIEVQFDFEEISIPEHLKTEKLEKNSVLQTMILFPKPNGSYVSYYLNIFPDNPEKKFKLKDFIEGGYQKIPSDFSGVYRFYRGNGTFTGGWRIEDGEKTHRIIEGGNLPVKNTSSSRISYFNVTCYQVITTWYQYSCSATGGCTTPVSIGQTIGYECEMVLAGPSTGGESGGGGGGSPEGSNEPCELPEGNLEGVTINCLDEMDSEEIIDYITSRFGVVLNDCEKQILRTDPKYWSDAVSVFFNKELAEYETIIRFGTNGANECSDAFRHAYWNALNTISLGLGNAFIFGTAHECRDPSQYLDVAMDLHNNEIGRNIAFNNSTLTSSALSNLVIQALYNGELKIISNLTATGFSRNSELITSSSCQ